MTNHDSPGRPDPMTMLVSSSSIAILAGVSRSTVSSWRNPARRRGFPEPTGGTGSRPLFTLLDVTQWLAKNRYWDEGRFLKLIPGVNLSQLAESLEVSPSARVDTGMKLLETACLAKIALLSGFKPASETTIEELRTAGLLAASTRPEWEILVGATEDDADAGNAGRAENLSEDVADLLQFANLMLVWAAGDSISKVDSIARRIVAEFFQPRISYPLAVGAEVYRDTAWSEEYHDVTWEVPTGPGTAVRAAVVAAVHAKGTGRTSPRKSEIDRDPLTVIDPCTGIGNALLSIADDIRRNNLNPAGLPVRFVGFESDDRQLLIARRRAFLANIPIEFHHANLLEEDHMTGLDADVMVALPPSSSNATPGNSSGYAYETSIKPHDSRWVYGIPTGELAWIMHAITHLRRAGKAVVRTPSAMIQAGGNDQVLRGLMSSGWVEQLSLGKSEDLWTLSYQPERKAVTVADRSSGKEAAASAIQTSWLMQHWSADLRMLLLDQSKRDPKRIGIQLDAATRKVTSEAENLKLALAFVEGNITGIDRLVERAGASSSSTLTGTTGSSVNRMSVGELSKTGYLEILSSKKWKPAASGADEGDTTVEILDTDVVVQLDDGIHTRRGPWTTPLTAKSFVLRVRKIEELTPAYLEYVLPGSWNERIRADQSKPKLADRLRAFEVPMLTPADQAEVEDAITWISLLRNHAQLLARESESLETSLLNAIRYGAVPPTPPRTNEKDNVNE